MTEPAQGRWRQEDAQGSLTRSSETLPQKTSMIGTKEMAFWMRVFTV